MEYAWYLLAAFPAAIAIGTLYWVVQDIRKERQIKKMMRDAEQQFRETGYPVWDLNSKDPE